MAKFEVKPGELKKSVAEQEKMAKSLKKIADDLDSVAKSSSLADGEYAGIRSAIQTLATNVRGQKTSITAMKNALDEIANLYEKTENAISGNQEKINTIKNAVSKIKTQLNEVGNNGAGNSQDSNAYDGDPVNMCNGNYVDEVVELQIPGILPLSFIRYYNAMDTKKCSMGTSWSHNYECQIRKEGQELVLVSGDGKEERFSKVEQEGKSSYHSVFGSYETITTSQEGYLLENVTKEKTWFNAKGQLLLKEDANGNQLLFTYEQDKLVHVERCISGEVEAKEFLDYTYGEAGYLVSVSDHTGRQVQMKHDQGLLVEVEATDHTKTQYTYDKNKRLHTITNAAGYVKLTNTYDEQGRVTKQLFADGEEMSYQYNDEKRSLTFIDRNHSKTTYIHDEKMRHIRTISEEGTENYSYNNRNTRTEYIDKNGNLYKRTFDNHGHITSVIDPIGNKTSYTYDAMGNLISIRDVLGRQTVQEYDKKGNLVKIIRSNGATTKMQYNDQGLIKEVIKPDSSTLAFTYDELGNMESIKEEGKGVTHYCYDELHRVMESVDGEGNCTTYSYDEKDRIVSVTNANGQTKEYTYQALGKVAAIKDFDGAQETWEYGPVAKPIQYTDKAGRQTLFAYDAMRNVSNVTLPNGATTHYEYNGANLLSKVTNALGASIEYEYDGNGNRIKEIDALGNETSYHYDDLNRNTSIIDANGNNIFIEYDALGNMIARWNEKGQRECYEYDEVGRLIKRQDVEGNLTTYTYTSLDQLETVTDAVGGVTTYEYYPGGLLQRITKPNGERESYTYNKNGNVLTKTSAENYTLTYHYDTMNRVTAITSNQGQEKLFTYDMLGRVNSMTDANGNTTTYEYSITGQLTKVIDALGNETEYTYDEIDQLVRILQKEGTTQANIDDELSQAMRQNEENKALRLTIYERDAIGQLLSVTDPLGHKETYEYDAMGRLTKKIDREGFTTEYCYTKLGDLQQIAYADGKSVEMEYDALRKLTAIRDWLGTMNIHYDALSRVDEVTDQQGRQISYEYGAMGERLGMTYPDGSQVTYSYDEALRLTAVSSAVGVTTYAYDTYGRLIQKTLPNGVQNKYTYDKSGFLGELLQEDQQGKLDSYTYEYDAMGNKIAERKERRGLVEESGTYTYQYDALNRLKAVQKDRALVRDYSYDAFGNRTIVKDTLLGTKQYQYNVADQLTEELWKAEDGTERFTNYTYDKRGNLVAISKQGTLQQSFHFSAQNRLEEAITPIGQPTKYIYNGLGHRVAEQNPSKQIDYIVDVTKQYHNLLMMETEESTQTFLWDHTLIGSVEKGQNHYYLQDELGSATRYIEETGVITATYGYDEFGNDLFHYSQETTSNNPYTSQGSVQPFGYTGYRMDTATGLYFAQAREYNSAHGRFISEDIVRGNIAIPYTLNHYGYCWGNPEKYVDENGEFPTIAIGALVGGIINGGASLISETVDYFKTGDSINWKDIGADTLTGAATGALVGSGAGIVAVTVGSGAAQAGNYALKTTLNNEWKDKSIAEHAANIGVNAVVGGVFGFIGGTSKAEIAAYKSLKSAATWDGFMNYLSKGNAWELAVKNDAAAIRSFLFKNTAKDAINALGTTEGGNIALSLWGKKDEFFNQKDDKYDCN